MTTRKQCSSCVNLIAALRNQIHDGDRRMRKSSGCLTLDRLVVMIPIPFRTVCRQIRNEIKSAYEFICHSSKTIAKVHNTEFRLSILTAALQHIHATRKQRMIVLHIGITNALRTGNTESLISSPPDQAPASQAATTVKRAFHSP